MPGRGPRSGRRLPPTKTIRLYILSCCADGEIFSVTAKSPCAGLSVAASVIALLLLFAIGTVVQSAAAGLWACLLMALAAPQIQQARDARSYMFMIAACLAAAFALVLINRFGPNWRRCLALALATLIAPLLHYMALATVGAMLLYAITCMKALPRRATIYSLLGGLCIYALVWGPAFVRQHYRMVDDTQWLVERNTSQAHFTLHDLLTVPARTFLDLDMDQDRSTGLCLGAVVFLLPLLLYRKNPDVMLWWIWLVVPVGVALAIDLGSGRRTLGMAKYTIAAAPGVFLMLGLLAARAPRFGWVPAGFTALCCVICVPTLYRPPVLANWREVSNFITQRSNPNDPVLFVDSRPDRYLTSGLLSVSYYLAGSHHPLFIVDRPLRGPLLARLMKCSHACVIGDDARSLIRPIVPGMQTDHAELLVGMGMVGTIDPPRHTIATLARTTDR